MSSGGEVLGGPQMPTQPLLERVAQDGEMWKLGYDEGLRACTSEAWEYNVRGHNSPDLMLNAWVTEEEARGWLAPRFNRTVDRRRPAGPEEVAP